MIRNHLKLLRTQLHPRVWVPILTWPILNFEKIEEVLRVFFKWYFDLIKNALVVAGLFYAAHKTKLAFLLFLAPFSKLIFSLYCVTFLGFWEKPLRGRAKTSLQHNLLGYIVIPMMIGVIYYGFSRLLNAMMSALLFAEPH